MLKPQLYHNKNVMTFKALDLINFISNKYKFIQAFASFPYSNDRLSKEAFNIINENLNNDRKEKLL
jgi:hypothetical protein